MTGTPAKASRATLLPAEWLALLALLVIALTQRVLPFGDDFWPLVWKGAILTATPALQAACAVLLVAAILAWIRSLRGDRRRGALDAFRQSRYVQGTLWLDLLRLTAALWLVLFAHFLIKTSIHAYNPNVFDAWLWRYDRWLGLGHDPTHLAVVALGWPPILRIFDLTYSVLYPLIFAFTPPLLVLLSPTRALRLAAATGFCLLWIVGGALYLTLPSWGPVYTRPAQFEDALKFMPVTVYVQRELYQELRGVIERPQGPRPVRFGGAAAFPSLHLAVMTLFVLASRRVSRPWFWANLCVAALMFPASMVTGYHYLVDSMAGVGLGAMCYLGAVRWTGAFAPAEAGEEP